MKLLGRIYSRPADILAKAERDAAALRNAIREQDKVAARDALFNFAVTAYHVWDWVVEARPELKKGAPHPMDTNPMLRVCRDLANASKHAALNVTRGTYRKHPPVTTSVVVSVAPSRTNAVDAGTHWRFKIQPTAGPRTTAEEFADQVLMAWQQYFKQHAIK